MLSSRLLLPGPNPSNAPLAQPHYLSPSHLLRGSISRLGARPGHGSGSRSPFGFGGRSLVQADKRGFGERWQQEDSAMNFGLSGEQQLIVDTVRSFAEKELYTQEEMGERTGPAQPKGSAAGREGGGP